eukprot:GILK01009180.1.p1 GENE.GILK01009180.1~~GILK01009180.1.p1  ORF type:complete len:1193 (+),score=253.04 GILK01009180.1:32-3580(+)
MATLPSSSSLTADMILGALAAIYNPMCSPVERLQATQMYEEFTKHANNMAVALALCAPIQPDHVRLAGFNSVLQLIKNFWNSLSVPEKEEFKMHILRLLSEGTKPLGQEAHFVKEKLASVLAQVAKREWPSLWQNMLPAVLEIGARGETTMELVCVCLRVLSEECSVFHVDLPAKRHKELLNALIANAEPMLGFLYNVLAFAYAAYQQQQSTNAPTLTSIQLLNAATMALISTTEWIDPTLFFSKGISGVLGTLLTLNGTQMNACDCVLALTSKKSLSAGGNADFISMVDYLCRGFISLGPSLANASPDDDESYSFHKKLAEILSLLCSLHGDAVITVSMDVADRMFQSLFAFWNHPSLTVANSVVTAVQFMLRNPHIHKTPWLTSVVFPVVSMAFDRVAKPTKGSLSSQFTSQDFDDKEEFSNFWGAFRGKLLEMLREVAILRPEASFRAVLQLLQRYLASDDMIPREGFSGTGSAAADSPAAIQWDSIALCIEHIISTFNPNVVTSSSVITAETAASEPVNGKQLPVFVPPSQVVLDLASELYRLILIDLSARMKDATLVARLLSVLGHFSHLFSMRSDLLIPTLQKLFEFMSYRSPHDPASGTANLSMDTQTIRKRGAHAIIRLCDSIPTVILPLFTELVQQMVQLVRSDDVSVSQQVALYEALATVSNSRAQFNEHGEFLMNLLSQQLQDWCGPITTEIVSDPIKLLNFIFQGKQTQWRLFHLMSIFLGVARRSVVTGSHPGYGPLTFFWDGVPVTVSSRNPFGSLAGQMILPNLLTLIRSLHLLYAPETMSTLTPVQQQALAMAEGELHAVLDKELPESTSEPGQDSSLQDMRRCLTHTRDASYNLLGSLCVIQDGLFNDPSMSLRLRESLLAGINAMEYRHLKLLLRHFVTPFVVNCPAILFQPLCAPLLGQLLSVCFWRLSEHWTTLDARLQQSSSLTQELLEDRLLRDVTRAVIDMLYTITHQTSSTQFGPGEDASKSADFRCEQLTANETIAGPLFLCLIGFTCWPDSTTNRKAIAVSQRLIPFVCGTAAFEPPLTELLSAAVRGLMSNRVPELESQFVALIHAIYRSTFASMPGVTVNVFRQLPQITPESLESLQQALSNESEQKQRQLLKEFTQHLIGIRLSNQDGIKSTIVDLPSRLVRSGQILGNKSKSKMTDVSYEPDGIGLAQLFAE